MTPASRAEILLAYRHLYQHLLRAVQYSKPARFVAQERLRKAFRNSTPDDYDAVRIARTLEFLRHAAEVRGFEHRLLKNLMHVWWERGHSVPKQRIPPRDLPWRNVAYEDFDRSIAMLNQSMGLCIK